MRSGAGARWLALLALGSLGLAGCGAGSAGDALDPGGRASAQPQLLMTGPDQGFLVWTGGGATVVLATSDGFRTVSNATPPAVPTDGGVVLARDGDRFLAGVVPSGLLGTSPFLVGDGSRAGWEGGQLPGAISPRVDAVALQGDSIWAVLGSGAGTQVSDSSDAGVSWSVSATAGSLDPTGGLVLTGVTWSDATHGWLTGVGPAGRPVLFASDGAGAGWAPVPLPMAARAGQVSVYPPCGSGSTLTALVVDRPPTGVATAVVVRSPNGGTNWDAGQAVPLPGSDPVLACGPSSLWLSLGGVKTAARLLVSTDRGGTWRQAGSPPGTISALAVSDPGVGYAVIGSGAEEALWSVSSGGASFRRMPLPGWVAQLARGGES